MCLDFNYKLTYFYFSTIYGSHMSHILIVGVKGQGAHIYIYVGSRAQSEDSN